MRAKTVLNQSLYTDTPFPRAQTNFLFAALQHSRQKNYSVVNKILGRAICPPYHPKLRLWVITLISPHNYYNLFYRPSNKQAQ